MSDIDALQAQAVSIESSDNGTKMVVNPDGSIRVSHSGEDTAPLLFSVVESKSSIGATELMTLYLKNPNASGKTVNLKSILITNTHTVDGSWIRWRVYSNPTSSANGSALTIRPLGIGSGNTSVCSGYDTPTVSNNGGLLLDIVTYSGMTTQYDFKPGSYLSPNNTLLITAVADGTGRSGQVTLVWTEL